MTVVDTSVVVDHLLGAPSAAGLPAHLGAGTACAPELLVAEVLLSAHRAEGAVADLLALDIQLIGHAPLARRAFTVRRNLTSADALYVALAETLGEPLLTADAGLAPGARRHGGVTAITAR